MLLNTKSIIVRLFRFKYSKSSLRYLPRRAFPATLPRGAVEAGEGHG